MDVGERISSKTGKAVLLPDEDNHDEEKMLEPKGFDRPDEGNVVKEPERRRLLRSDKTEDATGEATDAEWRSAGRIEAVGVALDWGKSCSCSLNDSVDVRVLELGVLEAAYC
jgi:hypothetical protein